MNKVLVLDESGRIDSDCSVDKYFVLGGLLYNIADLKKISEKLVPALDLYRDILEVSELKSNEFKSKSNVKNLVFGAIIGTLNMLSELKPILYVIDKSKVWVFDTYDKKSFKYNKAIEFLINDLITDGLLQREDTLKILIDNIELSKLELENVNRYLPNNMSQVISVDLASSKDYNLTQLADIIAGIPGLNGNIPKIINKDHRFKMMQNCYIKVFPKKQTSKLISSTDML